MRYGALLLKLTSKAHSPKMKLKMKQNLGSGFQEFVSSRNNQRMKNTFVSVFFQPHPRSGNELWRTIFLTNFCHFI